MTSPVRTREVAALDRRKFLKAGAGIVVVAAVGGAAYYFSQPPATTTPATTTLGPSPTLTTASPTPTGPKYGGTLVIGGVGDPMTLNPSITTHGYSHMITSSIIGALLNYDLNVNPLPRLATSWQASSDAKSYTFKLADTKWHDGTPFTSADVKFSVEQVLLLFHPQGKLFFGDLEAIETPDDRTVVFKWKKPMPYMLYAWGTMHSSIIAKHLYEGTDIRENPWNWKPVGTEAFKFKEYLASDRVVAERNPEFYIKDRPYLEKVVWKAYGDALGLLRGLENNEVDAVSSWVPHTSAEDLKKRGVIVTKSGLEAFGSCKHIFFDHKKDMNKNVKMRMAVAHSINYDFITKNPLAGLNKRAISPISSDLPTFHNPNVPRYDYDPAKANSLLDEAGLKRGADGIRFKAELITTSAWPELPTVAEIIRNNLSDVGITIEIRVLEMALFYERHVYKADFEMALGSTTSGPDPFIAGFVGRPKQQGFVNARLDELLIQGGVETDLAKRKQIYDEVQEIMMENVFSVPLYEGEGLNAYWPYVKQFPGDPFNGLRGGTAMMWLDK